MTVIRLFALVAILFQICFVSLAAADDQKACYYLDKKGLFQGNELLCQWSMNGGSGTREQFSLDGNFAVPILKTPCETPFSHEYTDVGFGDWYLTLCGIITGERLYISYGEDNYFVSLESLSQWTRFTPGKFPLEGDKGH